MNLEKYELKSGEKLQVFEFVSVGVKGKIVKIVQYTPTNYKDLYNLGFGEKMLLQEKLTMALFQTMGIAKRF